MNIVVLKRHHDAAWYGWLIHRVYIITDDGWYRQIEFKGQNEALSVIQGAETAAIMLGQHIETINVREG